MHPEKQLVRQAADGDEAAFRRMWSEHRDAVYRFACWVMQDADVAEDVVQECFLALLAKPDRFDQLRKALREVDPSVPAELECGSDTELRDPVTGAIYGLQPRPTSLRL